MLQCVLACNSFIGPQLQTIIDKINHQPFVLADAVEDFFVGERQVEDFVGGARALLPAEDLFDD